MTNMLDLGSDNKLPIANVFFFQTATVKFLRHAKAQFIHDMLR